MRQALQSSAAAVPADVAVPRPGDPVSETVFVSSGAGFGGIRALMDTAAANSAGVAADGPVITVAVSRIAFENAARDGDVVGCWSDVVRRGATSITLAVEAWSRRPDRAGRLKVASAEYTFVAVDGDGRPRPIR